MQIFRKLSLLGKCGIRRQISRPLTFSPCSHSSSGSEGSLGELYSEILTELPKNRCLVFAYGSGVFRQDNNDMRGNMTDFIIGVNSAEAWHTENLASHPGHYSGLARLAGAARVTRLQKEFGAKFYFNTLVPWRDKGQIKYGVISRADLEADLMNWTTLYLAGRLHKPVKILECDQDIKIMMKRNLLSALTTALLLLPASFTEEELYLTIAGLSYTGDFRMVVGEDKNKVSNIVRPQMQRFRDLYSEALSEFGDNLHVDSAGHYEQHDSPETKRKYILRLPLVLQRELTVGGGGFSEKANVLTMTRKESGEEIRRAVGEIVARTDKEQALKGILTAGGSKTIVYSLAKLKKMLKSMNKT